MTETAPKRVPMQSPAQQDDPVLAAHESLFRYVHNKTGDIVGIVCALLGFAAILGGGTFIAREDFSTVVGILLVVVGAALVAPVLLRLVKGGVTRWSALVGPSGTSPMSSATFVLRGGQERASEVYAKIAGSNDARSWPTFNRNRTEGDIRAGVHLRRGSKELVITLWIPEGDHALVWPMLTPAAENLDDWIRSIFPRNDTASDSATYIQNLNN